MTGDDDSRDVSAARIRHSSVDLHDTLEEVDEGEEDGDGDGEAEGYDSDGQLVNLK
jgi:hypothetical protein